MALETGVVGIARLQFLKQSDEEVQDKRPFFLQKTKISNNIKKAQENSLRKTT